MNESSEAMAHALRARLGRRAMLRGVGALGLTSLTGAALSGCSRGVPSPVSAGQSKDFSTKDHKLAFSNWPSYLDVDPRRKKPHPTLAEFEQFNGIAVDYKEDITGNEEYFAKIRPQLSAGKDINRDLIVVTDWLAARLIQLKWVQKYNHLNIVNLRNLVPALRNSPSDPQRDYTVPWLSGMTGIAYNSALVSKPVLTITQLLTDKELKGRVTLLSELRDTVGLVLRQLGKNPANVTDADFDAAIAVLEKAVASGQIRRFAGSDYTADLAAGTAVASVARSGDVARLQAKNPAIKFAVPDAGGMLWTAEVVMPVTARHRKNAEALLDYYYSPDIAARLAAAVRYICPVLDAQEEMAKINPSLATSHFIFPPDETIAKLATFAPLDVKTDNAYNAAFQKVIAHSVSR